MRSMIELITTEQVMHALGGTWPVAELTGRKYTAAAHWFKGETFPPNTFLVMQAALKAKGMKAPAALWRMTEAAQ